MADKLFLLIDAICEAYDNPNYRKAGATWCNLATQYVCDKMGFNKFDGMLANEMVKALRDSKEWSVIKMDDAQGYANQGRLVVAGMQIQPHGHVCVVRPGVAIYSGKWGCNAPKVSNIGAKNRIDTTLAWIFEGGDKPEVFLYKD